MQLLLHMEIAEIIDKQVCVCHTILLLEKASKQTCVKCCIPIILFMYIFTAGEIHLMLICCLTHKNFDCVSKGWLQA